MYVRQRASGHDPELHSSFLGRAVAFFYIALQTSRRDVIPRVDPASGARNDVIDRQVRSSDAAILTCVVIAVQNVAS